MRKAYMTTGLFFLCLLFTIFYSTAVIAADSKIEKVDLGSIQVTAHQLAVQPVKLYRDQILTVFPSDLSDILAQFPGVISGNSGARNEPALYVHGFDTKHLPLYVDGIPVSIPYDGYTDLGRFLLHGIASVELCPGFSSLLLGPNAFAGALNLQRCIPVKPVSLEIGSSSRVDSSGKFAQWQGWLQAALRRQKWYLQLEAGYINRDHVRLADDFQPVAAEDGGERNRSYREDGQLSVTAGFTPNATDEYRLTLIRQRGSKGIPVYAGPYTNDVRIRYWDTPAWDKDSLYLLTKTALTESLRLETRFWYDNFKNTFVSYDDDSYTTISAGYAFTSYYDDYTAGGATRVIYTDGNGYHLAGSIQAMRQSHRSHNAGDPELENSDWLLHAAVEGKMPLGKQLNLSGGFAGSLVVPDLAQDWDSVNSTVTNFATSVAGGVDGQLILNWKITENHAAAFKLGHRTRLPTMKDRYSYRLGKALPNPGLDPERVWRGALSYQGKPHRNLKISVETYLDDARDFVQEVDVTASEYQLQNTGRVVFYGGSILLNWTPLPWFGVQLHGGALNWWREADQISVVGRSHWEAGWQLHFAPVQKLRLLVTGRLIDERTSSDDATRKTERAVVWDSSVSWNIDFGLRVQCSVRNIGDKLFAFDEGYPMPGREYALEAVWKY